MTLLFCSVHTAWATNGHTVIYGCLLFVQLFVEQIPVACGQIRPLAKRFKYGFRPEKMEKSRPYSFPGRPMAGFQPANDFNGSYSKTDVHSFSAQISTGQAFFRSSSSSSQVASSFCFEEGGKTCPLAQGHMLKQQIGPFF